MDFTNVTKALTARGFKVSSFETAKEAAEYLNSQIDGATVGFGGSITLEELGLYALLSGHNTVFSHWHLPEGVDAAALRAQALDLLNGLDEARAVRVATDAVLAAQESDAFCELAAEILASRVDADVAARLLDGYDAAPDFARTLILEALCNFPGDARVYERMLEMLKNRPEQRADAARLLGRYGDARAIEPLKALLDLTDIGYYEYMEVRNAVEALGGEVENEREFYGDPDYEYLGELE